jgi:hypothetical protein
MDQAKKTQGPWQRQNEVDEIQGIKDHGVPLSQEWQATITEGIPKGNVPLEKVLLMKKRVRMTEETKIPGKKSLISE